MSTHTTLYTSRECKFIHVRGRDNESVVKKKKATNNRLLPKKHITDRRVLRRKTPFLVFIYEYLRNRIL